MKLSCDKDHPNYHPQAFQCKVFLEGAERTNVFYADEEGRHAILWKLNEHGHIMFKDGKALEEHFWGHVRIEVPPGFIDPANLKTYTVSVTDGTIEDGGITWFVPGDEP